MLRPLVLAATLLLYAGCDALTADGPVDFAKLSQDPAALDGTWDWVRDSSFRDGRRIQDTPSSTGLTGTVEFAEGTMKLMTVEAWGWQSSEAPYAVVEHPGRLSELVVASHVRHWFGTGGDMLVMREAGFGTKEREFRRQR